MGSDKGLKGGLTKDMVIEKLICTNEAKITNWGTADGMVGRNRSFVHLGWDVDGTYYSSLINVDKVEVSEEAFDVYDIKTCATVGWESDNAFFSSTMDHKLLCVDAKFHPLEEVIDKNLWLQVARGNGHKVRVTSVKQRPEKWQIFHMKTRPHQNFIMNRLIHES